MRCRVFLLILTAWLACVAMVVPAQAAWVWSPQTGWVGPGGAVKDSPEEQLVFAVAFFDREDYKRASKEFRKLLKAYKASRYDLELKDYEGILEWLNEYRPNPNGRLYVKDNRLVLPGEDA